MGDSSDEDLPGTWVLYAHRPEWADVKPLQQDDGINPVVQIAYSEKFKDVFDYFRAIIASGEKSERALELTESASKLNAANYTVWQYRREIFKALGKDLYEELEFIQNVIMDNPKNYQVWHHRRVIVEWLSDPSMELELTAAVLEQDAKNYHAWQHRQWAIKTYNLFDDELYYVDGLIADDVRNNSAWNQRFFVLKHTGFTPEVIQRELNYVMNRIRFIKNNESTWNFLRGLLQQDKDTLDQYPEVTDFCEDLYQAGNRSPYLVAFLIDLYMEKVLRDEPQASAVENGTVNDMEMYKTRVFDLCKAMANEYDEIRVNYWKYVQVNFQRKLDNLRDSGKS